MSDASDPRLFHGLKTPPSWAFPLDVSTPSPDELATQDVYDVHGDQQVFNVHQDIQEQADAEKEDEQGAGDAQGAGDLQGARNQDAEGQHVESHHVEGLQAVSDDDDALLSQVSKASSQLADSDIAQGLLNLVGARVPNDKPGSKSFQPGESVIKDKGIIELLEGEDLKAICESKFGQIQDNELPAIEKLLQKVSPDPTSVNKAVPVRLQTLEIEAANLREFLEKGCPSRGAVGAKCQRAMTPDQQSEYKKKDLKQKAQFRATWAEMQLTIVNQEKSKLEEISYIDKNEGRYLTLQRICREFADNRAGIAYVAKCTTLQGKWIKYSDMASCWLYLYVEESHIEEFKRAWTLKSSSSAAATAPSSSAPANEETPMKSVNPKAKAKAKATPKMSPKAGGADEEPHAKRMKTPLDVALSDASNVKKTLATTMSRASALRDMVASGGEWSWANNQACLQELTEAMSKIDAATDPFARFFATAAPQTLKKRYENVNELIMKLQQYTTVLGPLSQTLMNEVAQLLRMNQARSA
jgi:hypothetical protein